VRAVLYQQPGRFEIVDLPTPVPGQGEVRVAMVATGICGTDVHINDGNFFAVFPLTPGHEPYGVVDALGDDVSGLVVGQRVAVNGNSGCGACAFCRRGRPLLCRQFSALGVTGPGGFAEFMLAPAAQCFAVDGLADDAAVLVEPTACAVHGVEVLAPEPGSDALVLGSGPTGLILAQLLAHAGAARVTVAAPSAFKLEVAHGLGVDETVLFDRGDASGSVHRLRELAPEGFDVVVDATGAAQVNEETLALARDGGTILWYGVVPPDERVAVSPYEVYRRELTIKGSFAQINSFPRSIAMLRGDRVRTDGIITHRFALDTFGGALEAVRGDRSCLKAIVEL